MKLWWEFIELIDVKTCCEIFGRYFIYLVIGISNTKCGSISLTCPSIYVNMLDFHHTYIWEDFAISPCTSQDDHCWQWNVERLYELFCDRNFKCRCPYSSALVYRNVQDRNSCHLSSELNDIEQSNYGNEVGKGNKLLSL